MANAFGDGFETLRVPCIRILVLKTPSELAGPSSSIGSGAVCRSNFGVPEFSLSSAASASRSLGRAGGVGGVGEVGVVLRAGDEVAGVAAVAVAAVGMGGAGPRSSTDSSQS